MKVVVKLFFFVTLLCAIGGFIGLISSISGGGNVMQQTGAIAFSIGLAVVPYVIAMNVEKILL